MTDPPDRSDIFNEASIHDGSDVAAGPVVPVLNPVPQEDHDPAFVTFPETCTRVEPDTSAGVYPPAPDIYTYTIKGEVTAHALLLV